MTESPIRLPRTKMPQLRPYVLNKVPHTCSTAGIDVASLEKHSKKERKNQRGTQGIQQLWVGETGSEHWPKPRALEKHDTLRRQQCGGTHTHLTMHNIVQQYMIGYTLAMGVADDIGE